MPRKMETRPIFSISNPNKSWVVSELDRLRSEWASWLQTAQNLEDSLDYNPQTCAEAVKDGFENLHKHALLREKTLVFLGNNFAGYEFLFEDWPSHPHEDNLSRLRAIIPGWLRRLEKLNACIDYARMTDGYWMSKGKQLADKIIEVGAERGADIAASWLKNPTSA
jgi:hypothetical protein